MMSKNGFRDSDELQKLPSEAIRVNSLCLELMGFVDTCKTTCKIFFSADIANPDLAVIW